MPAPLSCENIFTLYNQTMSKDKGSKNHKKSPADKSLGKVKKVSAYKSEYTKDQHVPIEILPTKGAPKGK